MIKCTTSFVLAALFASYCFAQDNSNEAQVGRLIRIKLPITGSADLRVKRAVDQLLENLPSSASRPTLVFEFSKAPGGDQSPSEFERCLSLARLLTSEKLSRFRTVAYIPDDVTSHAVLVAIACEEIIVADDAILGDASQGEGSIEPVVRGGYKEIADRRRTVPVPVALGMLDKDLAVYKVTTANGVLFAVSQELEQIQAERAVRRTDTVIAQGDIGKFRGDELRELGFASYVANDREELARFLKIPSENLEFDPSLGGAWNAIRVELHGPINSSNVERVMNSIQQQQDLRQANFVSISIRTEGGSLAESVRLANFLADLDRSQIRTVAYIDREARADATLIAFACDHVVVKPDAIIGGPGAASISEEEVSDLMAPISLIAEKKSKFWSLPMAMLDSNMNVFEFQQKDTQRKLYVTEAELIERFGEDATDNNRPDAWTMGPEVTTAGQTLKIDGNRANDLGFARFTVEGYDELKQIYQLEETPELVGPNWAFELVEVLASPQVAGGLLFIGIFALYIEISSPGLGIGAFVASVCFVLYFWANFMNGTAEVLEIILFLTGVIFILIEIFVLPGFGIFGLGGGILIVASLILATQTFIIPTNDYQMKQLPRSMLMVVGAFGGVIAAGVLLRKYIHRAPILGRVMLHPPEGDAAEELNRRESLVDYEYLLGQTGTASTRLSPAGKAMFEDDLVDVVSDGSLIDKNQKIRVIEVFGNRVVVEAIQ